MKHTYPVKIVETLEKTVFIEAYDKEDAQRIAEDRWKESEYILDADSFTGVEFFVGEHESYRYYCLMRPVGPGAVPHGFTDWGELDHTIVIPSINHCAWGWVEYEHPLTDKEIHDYELAYAGEDF